MPAANWPGLSTGYAGRLDVLVLALPRGGVPVAYEIALALHAPLDVLVVRKLGAQAARSWPWVPWRMAASASSTRRWCDAFRSRPTSSMRSRLLNGKNSSGGSAYRGNRRPPQVRGKIVILVDDGVATGASLRAALAVLRHARPVRIVVAVPVASAETWDEVRDEVDEVICAWTPAPFFAVGHWYEDFSQTSDQEVRDLLGWSACRESVVPPKR